MNDQLATLIRAASTLLGWIYVLSWSASFYPQPILNWQRKNTHGLSIDFPTLNVLGFVCYTIATSSLLYSPIIRQQYAARHPVAPEPTVRVNDLVFGVHAVILVLLYYSQFFPAIWGFTVSKHQRLSTFATGIVVASAAAVLAASITVFTKSGGYDADPFRWTWIDVVYICEYVKLVATFVKYIPQAWVNYKRKSTAGWSIITILCDIVGGVLSIIQLIIDSSFQGDWSGITGNPVKFGLANISIFFDLIFMTQHYILYREADGKEAGSDDEDAEQRLLRTERD